MKHTTLKKRPGKMLSFSKFSRLEDSLSDELRHARNGVETYPPAEIQHLLFGIVSFQDRLQDGQLRFYRSCLARSGVTLRNSSAMMPAITSAPWALRCV